MKRFLYFSLDAFKIATSGHAMGQKKRRKIKESEFWSYEFDLRFDLLDSFSFIFPLAHSLFLSFFLFLLKSFFPCLLPDSAASALDLWSRSDFCAPRSLDSNDRASVWDWESCLCSDLIVISICLILSSWSLLPLVPSSGWSFSFPLFFVHFPSPFSNILSFSRMARAIASISASADALASSRVARSDSCCLVRCRLWFFFFLQSRRKRNKPVQKKSECHKNQREESTWTPINRFKKKKKKKRKFQQHTKCCFRFRFRFRFHLQSFPQ